MMRGAGTAEYIAGWKTAEDWRRSRGQLHGPGAPWKKAFEEYFVARLTLRYLNPIKLLQEHGTFQGEGFSIVAIQCTLIEFLAATRAGKGYRLPKRGEPALGEFEYSKSAEMFIAFLSQIEPFSKDFSPDLAQDFYSSVRCGLLHEARTKDGWTIWARGEGIIDPDRKVVHRDNMQSAIETYVANYGKELLADAKLQAAFVRKFDALAG
ncbi:hypothetical protein GFM09_37475 [Rhizobium leguminosarum bv. viciae]|uniref:hypothetical protein n=1 Tax=Rhizobium leguminosarum TaxID=384 RepID=UPI0014417A40|nr:hypothetical protein [Rhizobium leguminosarum]NKL74801.1 hypothetical protein [Rhizobium leguminosarum bv. viciae]